MANKKSKTKKVIVTMEFESSAYYPEDDMISLTSNIRHLLTSKLTTPSLLAKLKNTTDKNITQVGKDAIDKVVDEEIRIGNEMIKSLDIKVVE